MHPRTVADIGHGIAEEPVRDFAVRVGLDLGDHTDYIHPESVDALFAPPVHHIEYFTANLRILPVQVRLLG